MKRDKKLIANKTGKKSEHQALSLNVWKNLPPAPTSDEVVAWIKEYKEYGDIKTRDKVVYSQMRYITFWINAYAKNIINCVTSVYPSFEDLQQEAILITMKAVEDFNPEYNFTFGTFLSHKLLKLKKIKKRMKAKKRQAIVVSLDAPRKNAKKQDEDGLSLGETISDDRMTEDIINDQIEFQFIKKEILSFLPKKDRDMFSDAYVDGLTQEQMAAKYGMSQVNVSRLLIGIKDRILAMYLNGITDFDKALRGVRMGRASRFVKNQMTINKYGKDFLQDYFLPTLAKNQRAVFEQGVLLYYGQPIKELATSLGMSTVKVEQILSDLQVKLEVDAPKLQQMQKEGVLPKPRQLPAKVRQKISKNNRLMEEYGGRLFLAKYFLRALTEVEKKVFKVAVLEFNGESMTQLANKSGVSVNNFGLRYNAIIDKLAKTDFEALVDLVDNAELYGTQLSSASPSKIDKMKQRLAIVERFGGKETLEELFLPVLPESQARILSDMYLIPKFDSFESMAKHYGIKVNPLLVAEKVMLEKLESTNIKELKALRERAEQELRLESFDKSKKGFSRSISKFGGKEFLLEMFYPKLQIRAHQIIFKKYMIENCPIKEVLEELGLPAKAVDYVTKTTGVLLSRLSAFKASFKDFDKEVKNFYAKREFDKTYPEDFEKRLLGEVEKETQESERDITLSNVGKTELLSKRRKFMEEFLSQYGEKKQLVREFMPTLKKVVFQQVFLGTFLEGKLDIQVQADYGLTQLEFRDAKKSVLSALDNYAKQKKSNSNAKNKGGRK